MRRERLITALVLLILGFQVTILYRSYRTTGGQPRRSPVENAPAGKTLDFSHFPVRGSSDAKVVLVEFSDYECPFCARHAAGVAKEIEKRFIMTGKVKQVFVNNPLPMHLHAELFASAAICAGNQGQYWEMYEAIFAKKPTSETDILSLAKAVNVKVDIFQQCLKSTLPAETIQRDTQTTKDFGLEGGTPSFAIGTQEGDGSVKVLKYIRGAQPFSVFEAAIDEILKSPS